jgi:peptide-methionine (S)-S-oxide reductase
MRSFLLAATLAMGAVIPAASAETAIFAGGCFWCVESDMDHVKGVTATISGYAGGTLPNPTYENHEGHIEAVKVEFDPKVVSYDTLVNHFLRTIDVTDDGGQFCDRGHSYITTVFTFGEDQMKVAQQAISRAEKDLGQKVVTPVVAATTFTDAEDYHQNYYLGEDLKLTRFGIIAQNKAYVNYRKGCGRDERVKQVWGDKAFSYPVPAGAS